MKVTSPLYSLRAWQKISSIAIVSMYNLHGSCVFHRLGNYTRLMKYTIPTNPRTEVQQANRTSFASAVASWQGLSDEEKTSWKKYQNERRRRPVMDGYNLYISKFLLSGGSPQIPPDGRASAR